MFRRFATGVFVLLLVTGCAAPQRDPMTQLPKSIGGETLVYDVRGGVGPSANSWAEDVRAELGMPREAVTSATGFRDPARSRYQTYVLQIKGARGIDIIPLMAHAFWGFPGDPATATIEGKTVWTYPCQPDLVDPTLCGYYYAFGDTAILIYGSKTEVAEALHQLP